MQKRLRRLGILIILLAIAVAAGGTYTWNAYLKDAIQERAIEKVVGAFGTHLDEVPLLADRETVAAGMAASYGPFVSPKLLGRWQAAPEQAPGRLTSSPWPDRIEIEYMDKLTPTRYMVTAHIIEITSTDVETGGVAARRRITLAVEKTDSEWRITHVVLGAYEQAIDS